MRDPAGAIAFEGGHVVRHLAKVPDQNDFLHSDVARSLVDSRALVAYEFSDPQRLVTARREFVTYPTEWCAAQLSDAAVLTLDVGLAATAAGYELKDASAWNVIFDGVRPIFCDLLSFQPLSERAWAAAGQFSRHFVTPLWLSAKARLRAHECFQLWRDGVPPERARALLGWRRFTSLAWPSIAAATRLPGVHRATAPADIASMARYRQSLTESLRWMVRGFANRTPLDSGAFSPWASYDLERAHYQAADLHVKRAEVARLLLQTKPSRVLDLGCNAGEFTEIALETGARVVALDADHACIERLYRKHVGRPDLYPVLSSIDDLSGGRGWCGSEVPGLLQRLQGTNDMVMMLAIIHHLAVAAAVPLPRIAELARSLTRRHLIIEWIAPEDPQMALLCAHHSRRVEDFSIARQRQAFVDAGFSIDSETAVGGACRQLALLSQRP